MPNFRNLFSFFVYKRCLSTSSKIPLLHSPLPQITEDSNFALHFLTRTCGLPLKSAISVSCKFHFQQKNEKKLLSVIDYLKDEGFTQAHIAKFIQKHPRLLRSKVEISLKPKVEFLKQNGIVGELLIESLVKTPSILSRSLRSRIKPSLELLRSYIGSDDKIGVVMRRCSWLFGFSVKDILRPNIEFLVKEGVPSTSIAKIITLQPRSIVKEHSKIIYAVNAVKKLGLQPRSPMFVHGFIVMISLSESTLKKKVELLHGFGWTEMDVLTALRRFPQIVTCSEGNIRKSMEFYLNTVKLDLQSITKNPIILGYAIDTRVRPRYIVIKTLKSKKLIKENIMTLSWINLSNKMFLDKYVIKYEDNIPGLLDIYTAGKTAEKIGA